MAFIAVIHRQHSYFIPLGYMLHYSCEVLLTATIAVSYNFPEQLWAFLKFPLGFS